MPKPASDSKGNSSTESSTGLCSQIPMKHAEAHSQSSFSSPPAIPADSTIQSGLNPCMLASLPFMGA